MIEGIGELKKRIMRRIYVVFLMRNAAPFAFDCACIAILAFIATFFVSIRDVLANLSVANADGGLTRFSASALSETELSTKFLLVAFGVVGFLAMRHLKRAVRAARLVATKTPPPTPR